MLQFGHTTPPFTEHVCSTANHRFSQARGGAWCVLFDEHTTARRLTRKTLQLAFDIFTVLLAFTNALDRPHRQRVDVIVSFKRDGALFFCVSVPQTASTLVEVLTIFVVTPP